MGLIEGGSVGWYPVPAVGVGLTLVFIEHILIILNLGEIESWELLHGGMEGWRRGVERDVHSTHLVRGPNGRTAALGAASKRFDLRSHLALRPGIPPVQRRHLCNLGDVAATITHVLTPALTALLADKDARGWAALPGVPLGAALGSHTRVQEGGLPWSKGGK